MKNLLILILLCTSLGAAAALYEAKAKIAGYEANKTTDQERALYGEECVIWFTERAEKAGYEKPAYKLARSWRKHGQMVFEIVADWNQSDFISEEALCVVDQQSNVLRSYNGASREPWLFYK